MEDWEAWELYPEHRWVFNKLELSSQLGYTCGPTPMPVPVTGEYCVRPIYNLGGMSAGSKILHLKQGKILELPPSHFWCERFRGKQYSVNYEWQKDRFVPVHTSIGENSSDSIYRFTKWYVVEHRHYNLPKWIDTFSNAKYINIEFIEDKIIEIHLRPGEDFPDGASEIIPVYADEPEIIEQFVSNGWNFDEDYVDAEKNIPIARLGMLWR